MNIKAIIDEAMCAGMCNAVCSPQLYPLAVSYIRDTEKQREGSALLRPDFEIVAHAKQQRPPILIFDTRPALIEHLDALTTGDK